MMSTLTFGNYVADVRALRQLAPAAAASRYGPSLVLSGPARLSRVPITSGSTLSHAGCDDCAGDRTDVVVRFPRSALQDHHQQPGRHSHLIDVTAVRPVSFSVRRRRGKVCL